MRVLVAGGGNAGVFAARALQAPLARAGHELVVVNEENFMLYQSLLAEAAGGTLEPRHVVVPLRQVLRRATVIVGEITGIERSDRRATIRLPTGEVTQLAYDSLVLAPGSWSRTLPIPGLAEHGVGFKTLTEAIYLRNRVLSCLDAAVESTDPAERRSLLTFVFVGGGYAGVEALAELEDLARAACGSYRELRPRDLRWVLVEAADRILPEIGAPLAEYATRLLRDRGIEVRTGTRLESAEGGICRLSDGEEFSAGTLVWTAGVRPAPLAERSGFPVDDHGRVLVDSCLRVPGEAGVWALGDAAAVPDVISGGLCPPTAQHATRQARRLARNVLASFDGAAQFPFRYRTLGQLASLGRYKGVARVLGVRLHGFPAWWLARSYHVARIPTLGRKARIILDWTIALFFPRDITQLGSLSDPFGPFDRATGEDRS